MADLCRICHKPIQIPGLDAQNCPRCGWVPTLEWLAVLEQEKRSKRRRKKQEDEAA